MAKSLRLINIAIMLLALAATAEAQVAFSEGTGKIAIEINGQPFSDLYLPPNAPKPYLYPLRSATGKAITRQFPMAEVPGESRDHQHHRGLWFGHFDVNGTDFWSNEPSYHDKNSGMFVARGAPESKNGNKAGTLHASFDWNDPSGKTLLREERTMVFYADRDQRRIDFDILLTGVAKCVFGDNKDGTFAIRLADELSEMHTGMMVNSLGKERMAGVWGQRADWVDYSGRVEGEELGVAIFDHPANPGHPNRWLSRDYGLLANNPFGNQAFDKEALVSTRTLEPGQTWRYRWRVVIHTGDAKKARIAEMYRDYAR